MNASPSTPSRRSFGLRPLALTVSAAFLWLVQHGCGEKEVGEAPEDAGSPDAGSPDAGSPDAGPKNATMPDDRPIWHPIQDFARRGLSPELMKADGGDHAWAIEEGVTVSADGKIVFSGGAIRLASRTWSPADPSHPAHAKHKALQASGSLQAAPAIQRMQPAVAARYDAAKASEAIEVMVTAKREEGAPVLFVELEAEIGAGRVVTVGDGTQRHLELLEAKRERAFRRRAELETAIVAEGGEVVRHCPDSACVVARLASTTAERVAKHPAVATLSLPDVQIVAESNGIAVVEGSGLSSFIAQGYTGERGPSGNDDLHLAVIEQDRFHDDHHGFRDAALTPARIGERWVCDVSGICLAISDFQPPPMPSNDPNRDGTGAAQHATAMLGLAIGDLTAGQDPAITDPEARRRLSGIAREARAHLVQYSGDAGGLQAALSLLPALVPRPPVALLSQGVDVTRPCFGDDDVSRAVDGAYENGILVVKSAGNEGATAGATVCTVTSPGAAHSAFTVAAHGWPPQGDKDSKLAPEDVDAAAVRVAPRLEMSGWGGAPEDTWLYRNGRDRTIVDISAYGAWISLFTVDRTAPESSGYLFSSRGTSIAAAVMAGAAIDFLDYFKSHADTFGASDTFIEQPGALFANLLLLADRKGLVPNCPSWDSGRVCKGFDGHYGAGRLVVRRPDSLAGPAAWRTGAMFVHENKIARIALNDGAPLSDCTDVTVVLHWYDPLFAEGNVDDIDLYMAVDDERVLLSQTAGDNKERVVVRVPAGRVAGFDIVGFRVDRRDRRGDGAGQMRVHWAYFWEKAPDPRLCSG